MAHAKKVTKGTSTKVEITFHNLFNPIYYQYIYMQHHPQMAQKSPFITFVIGKRDAKEIPITV